MSDGEQSSPDWISVRRKLLRARKPARSPWCSIDCGQSCERKISAEGGYGESEGGAT